MGSGVTTGIHWSVQDGMFTFFGDYRGFIREGKWVVTADVFGGLKTINPMSIRDDIEGIIAKDVADGKGDRIAYVGVGPYQGILLALEGVITLQMLRTAAEATDRITMNVTLGGAERKLVILRESPVTTRPSTGITGSSEVRGSAAHSAAADVLCS